MPAWSEGCSTGASSFSWPASWCAGAPAGAWMCRDGEPQPQDDPGSDEANHLIGGLVPIGGARGELLHAPATIRARPTPSGSRTRQIRRAARAVLLLRRRDEHERSERAGPYTELANDLISGTVALRATTLSPPTCVTTCTACTSGAARRTLTRFGRATRGSRGGAEGSCVGSVTMRLTPTIGLAPGAVCDIRCLRLRLGA
jgi:hypothetical protein